MKEINSSEVVARPEGYQMSRFNAVQHGLLSRYTVLPWEDESEYKKLIDALFYEHRPSGPTEEHLAEELAGIIWRKRRLRLAESAAIHRGLEKTTDSYRNTAQAALAHMEEKVSSDSIQDAISSTPEQNAIDIADLGEDEKMTERAIILLRAGKRDAYQKALAALRDDTTEWWEEILREQDDEDEHSYTPGIEGLLHFLETKMQPWLKERRIEIESRSLIQAQAYGEAIDPDRLERLARYEVHLDRKLERTLSMLLKLKDLRGAHDQD